MFGVSAMVNIGVGMRVELLNKATSGFTDVRLLPTSSVYKKLIKLFKLNKKDYDIVGQIDLEKECTLKLYSCDKVTNELQFLECYLHIPSYCAKVSVTFTNDYEPFEYNGLVEKVLEINESKKFGVYVTVYDSEEDSWEYGFLFSPNETSDYEEFQIKFVDGRIVPFTRNLHIYPIMSKELIKDAIFGEIPKFSVLMKNMPVLELKHYYNNKSN